MRISKSIAAIVCGILMLAGCTTTSSTPLSPREDALQAGQVYSGVQALALQAVKSLVSVGKVDIAKQIDASTAAATDAINGYIDEASKCFRDPATGTVGNAPGQICDPNTVTRLLTVAQGKTDQAFALMAAFGFTPPAGTATKLN